jgi:hypothetical protein
LAFNGIEQKVIRYDQMIGMYKRNTAKVFPNAIEVVTLQHKYFFCSFMFRDAAFRLAATAWSDYLEASPSNDTHRLNVNSKLDLELFVKKPTGEEQVRMLDEPEEEGSEGGSSQLLGTSPTNEDGGGGSSRKQSKLGDSGKSNLVGASLSTSSLPGVDSSEDADFGGVDAAGQDKKSKRRKSSSGRKKEVTSSNSAATGTLTSTLSGALGSNKRDSMDFIDESDEPSSGNAAAGGPGSLRKETASPSGTPNTARNSVIVSSAPSTGSSATLKAKAVGFDLRHPAGADPGAAGGGNSAAASGSSTITTQGGAHGGGGNSSDVASNGEPGGPSNASGQGNPSTTASSSSVSSNQDRKTNSSASAPPPAASAPALPEIPFPVPTSTSCKHVLEESEDKKFSGTKIGQKTWLNLTLNQFFALVWCNRDYSNAVINNFGYTEWNAPPWGPSDGNCCAARLVTYRMPLNASLGPKSTRVDSYQNARFKNPNTLLIETSNISKDVPFGDAFEVHEKWTAVQDGPDVNLEVSAAVVWKKAAWGLKGTINTKSMEGVNDTWEFVNKNMDTFINKYTSAASAASSGSADAVPASTSSPTNAERKARRKQGSPDDEESSESDDERRARRRRKATRKNSKDGEINAEAGSPPSQHQLQQSLSSSSLFGSSDGGFELNLRNIAFIVLIIVGLGTLAAVFFSLLSVTSRINQLEVSRHHSASSSGLNHEEMNLRERVAFLEHLTTALLHNISDPGSYKSEQQRYWVAIRDIDKFLLKTRTNVETLQTAVHQAHIAHQTEPAHLSTSQLVDALKSLPIDRKVLNYLMNPDGFARQLSNVIGGSFDESGEISVSTIESSLAYSSWLPVYLGAAVCALVLIALGARHFLRSSS